MVIPGEAPSRRILIVCRESGPLGLFRNTELFFRYVIHLKVRLKKKVIPVQKCPSTASLTSMQAHTHARILSVSESENPADEEERIPDEHGGMAGGCCAFWHGNSTYSLW